MVILIFSVMSYMDYRVFQDFASAYKLLLRNDLIASGSAAYSCTCVSLSYLLIGSFVQIERAFS